jgi:hypothetical protein
MAKKEETALIVLEDKNVLDIFIYQDSLDKILQQIKDKTAGFIPNTETSTGREEIKSLAYKVTRSKTLLDKAGKELVEAEREKTKDIDARISKINASRRRAVEYLDNLQGEVRGPLNDYEAEQARVKEAEKLREQITHDHEEAILLNRVFDEDRRISAEKEELSRREDDLRIHQEALKLASTMRVREIIDSWIAGVAASAKENIVPMVIRGTLADNYLDKRKVNTKIVQCFKEFGLQEDQASRLLLAIIRKQIPQLTISYMR